MELTGLIFDVQRFSVHDGPGIRTSIFFKGCPLRCRWCQNPESLSPRPELAFMTSRCHGDQACVSSCPAGAIRPFGAEGDRIHRTLCDACGRCLPACSYRALELVGRTVTVDGLLEEVVRDLPFYRVSGGGVTFTGGEPTLQLEVVAALARACLERGIDVGIQTCGAFRWASMAPHLPLFSFIHFDLKVMDPAGHRRLTGADNRAILENARHLVEAGAPVRFRMPIIPDHTDGEDNLRQVAAFLLELGVPRIQLLRYHRLGEAKLERLGYPLRPLGLNGPEQARESLDRAIDLLTRAGLEVTS